MAEGTVIFKQLLIMGSATFGNNNAIYVMLFFCCYIGIMESMSLGAGIIVYYISLSQGLSQDLETGCPKLAVVKSFGVQMFKGDHNILAFQP